MLLISWWGYCTIWGLLLAGYYFMLLWKYSPEMISRVQGWSVKRAEGGRKGPPEVVDTGKEEEAAVVGETGDINVVS